MKIYRFTYIKQYYFETQILYWQYRVKKYDYRNIYVVKYNYVIFCKRVGNQYWR